MTPARRDEIRLALQNLSRGVYQHDLDLRGNGVASLVMELLDHGQRYESLRAEVERLTPKWQEGEPPDGPVWREGVAYPVRVKRSERYGLMYWDDGFWSWKADHGEPQPRWAPIPKPTEG